jgi:hypothetical protein
MPRDAGMVTGPYPAADLIFEKLQVNSAQRVLGFGK